MKIIITILILISFIFIYYIYLVRTDIKNFFLNLFKNSNNDSHANDNSHTELSDFVYAIGIGILTSSLVTLNYPSQNVNQTSAPEQYLNNLIPVLVGLILILCKNKIREGNKFCSVCSITILFFYIFSLIF